MTVKENIKLMSRYGTKLKQKSILVITPLILILCFQNCSNKSFSTQALSKIDSQQTPQPLPQTFFSNPITIALTGARNTYNVGSGQTFPDPDLVPWGSLQAGDVVNIFYRAQPYKFKIGLRAQGTANAPVVINGVTDENGNRPVLDFNGAKTASGCNPGGSDNVFNTSSAYSLEDYGGVVIKAGASDPYGTKPKWIQIKNLEIKGAAKGNTFVSLTGTQMTYGDSAGIWIQPAADILLENNIISDNAFGIFTMAKNDELLQACERIIARSNRVYGNGVLNNYYDHNFYIQSTNPIVEGNFIGQTRTGSAGSSYKSRSSGEIFRYNYVIASARAVDWVHSEDQANGIAAQSDYGTDYAYGNIIVNDCSLANCATNPIHYGGDNDGEQSDVAPVFTPSLKYRSHLYFYNNTVINKTSLARSYRTHFFQLSLVNTLVDAWNNIFYTEGDSYFSYLDHAGKINLVGTNLVFGKLSDADMNATVTTNFAVSKTGTIISSDPQFADSASNNYSLATNSPAVNKATNIPTLLNPDLLYMRIPLDLQIAGSATNGIQPRSPGSNALGLGALE